MAGRWRTMLRRRVLLLGFPLVRKKVSQFDCTVGFSQRHFVDGVGILRSFVIDPTASIVGLGSDLHTRCLMKCHRGIRARDFRLAWLPKPPLFCKCRYHGTIPDGGYEEEDIGFVNKGKKSTLVGRQPSRSAWLEAQKALLDYLHGTRALQFMDAEHISKNSPMFLHKLIQKVGCDKEVGRSIRKFLHYHPINEYEPFFESLGVEESELHRILPSNLMFLSDDENLLQSIHLLCNYGVPRRRIGKMYLEASEIFQYEPAVLMAQLKAYEMLGLSTSTVVKLVSCCPSLMVGGILPGKAGDANIEVCNPSVLFRGVGIAFVKLLAELESTGIGRDWIGDNISPEKSYNWSQMVLFMNFLYDLGIDRKEIGSLLRKHPCFLLEESGSMVFLIVGLLSKLGCSKKDLLCLFMQFPDSSVLSFLMNLRKGLSFLIEIGMPQEDICRILRCYPHIFGCCSLKNVNRTLSLLNVGKKRLCAIMLDDPYQLMNWAVGKKLSRLPKLEKDMQWLMHKTEFLLGLGFVENSKEFRQALSVFRGKGEELRERFNCFVEEGLDSDDVARMARMAPHILNQKADVLKSKIDFLVNCLGYPVQFLLVFPSYLSYSIETVKARFTMYNWLRRNDALLKPLSLSTILPCSEKSFIKRFVMKHPKGPQVWEEIKRTAHPDDKLS